MAACPSPAADEAPRTDNVRSQTGKTLGEKKDGYLQKSSGFGVFALPLRLINACDGALPGFSMITGSDSWPTPNLVHIEHPAII